jgi:ABC-type antimicrobial peptide transport system permease subunit
VPSVLSKNVLERALWTGVQVGIGLAITYLGSIPVWWAAPIALMLSALKTNLVDRVSQTESKPSSPTPDRPLREDVS